MFSQSNVRHHNDYIYLLCLIHCLLVVVIIYIYISILLHHVIAIQLCKFVSVTFASDCSRLVLNISAQQFLRPLSLTITTVAVIIIIIIVIAIVLAIIITIAIITIAVRDALRIIFPDPLTFTLRL